MNLSHSRVESLERFVAAFGRGDHWSTRDGKVFLEESEGIATFLLACGPKYVLVASDLIDTQLAAQRAIDFRAKG